MLTATFGTRVAQSRQRMAVLDRTYKRDKDGQFSSGGGYVGGQDLMKAGAAQLADDVVAGRSAYPRSRDAALSVIASRQGFDGKPQVVSKAEMDRLVGEGRPELLRGTEGSGGKSASQIHEEMRSGEAAFGHGLYGNGYYFGQPRSTGTADPHRYSDGTPGSIARATLAPGARVVGAEQVFGEHNQYMRTVERGSQEEAVFSDIGRFAAAKGYDAIQVPWTGAASDEYVVVNRTALIVETAS